MRALALVVLVVAVSGCHCGGPTMGVSSDLRVSPGALQFGDVAIGASLPLTFEVDNGGRASGDVMLTLDGPFTLSATTATVGAGSSAMFTVTFAPMATGPVTGTRLQRFINTRFRRYLNYRSKGRGFGWKQYPNAALYARGMSS